MVQVHGHILSRRQSYGPPAAAVGPSVSCDSLSRWSKVVVPYQVTIEENPSYVRANVSGDRIPGRELTDAVGAWSEVADVCRTKGINRVLATIDLSGRFPTLAADNLAKAPEDFGWIREVKMAVVDVNEESLQDNLFTETVAVNRGFPVRMFDNEQDARAWPLESWATGVHVDG